MVAWFGHRPRHTEHSQRLRLVAGANRQELSLMRAELHAAALGQLRGADLELTPGRYVVLASEREPLWSLVALLAGREPPRTGRALLDGVPAFGSPATRRKLAALFHDEA